MTRRSVLLMTALLFGGCKEDTNATAYHLVYPIQASKQKILRMEGTRFLTTTDTPELSAIVLNNPVAERGFADIAFSITNASEHPLKLAPGMLEVRTKQGVLPLTAKSAYEAYVAKGGRYRLPEGYEALMPKMQAFGCAAPKSEDNIDPATLLPSQKQIWKHYRRYRDAGVLDASEYFEGFTVAPGATRSAFFRVTLPAVDLDAERETMLVSLCPEEHSCKKIRLVIQPLDNE